MLGSLLIDAFYIFIAGSFSAGIYRLFQASIFDIRQTRTNRDQLRHPNSRAMRRRPPISVLIFANNNASTILACLESVTRSNYKNIEMIVIDNASVDNTKSLINQFMSDKPNKQMRLVAKKTPSSRSDALAAAAKYAQNEYVFVLDASCIVSKTTVKDLALRLANPDIDAVLPNIQVAHSYRIFGLVSTMRAAKTIWNKKASAKIDPTLDNYNYAALYRHGLFNELKKSGFRQALGDVNYLRMLTELVTYDGKVVVKAFAIDSGNILSAWSFFDSILAIFMLYIAIKFNNPGYIILAWLNFTSLLVLAIWSDESRSLKAKIQLSLLALVTYSLQVLQTLSNLIKTTPRFLKLYFAKPSVWQFPFAWRD